MDKKDIVDKVVDSAAGEVKKKLAEKKIGGDKGADKLIDSAAGTAKDFLSKKLGK